MGKVKQLWQDAQDYPQYPEDLHMNQRDEYCKIDYSQWARIKIPDSVELDELISKSGVWQLAYEAGFHRAIDLAIQEVLAARFVFDSTQETIHKSEISHILAYAKIELAEKISLLEKK